MDFPQATNDNFHCVIRLSSFRVCDTTLEVCISEIQTAVLILSSFFVAFIAFTKIFT